MKQDSSLEHEFVNQEDCLSFSECYQQLESNEDRSFVKMRDGTFCNLIPCDVLEQMTELYVEDGWEGIIRIDFKDIEFLLNRHELEVRHSRSDVLNRNVTYNFNDRNLFRNVLQVMVTYYASFCPDDPKDKLQFLMDHEKVKRWSSESARHSKPFHAFFENMGVPLWDGTFALYGEAVLHWTGNFFLEKSEAIRIGGGAYAFPQETIELHSGQIRLHKNLHKLDEISEVRNTSKQPLLLPAPPSLKPTTDSLNTGVVQDAVSQDEDESPSNLAEETPEPSVLKQPSVPHAPEQPPRPAVAEKPNRMERLRDLERRLYKNLRAAEEAIDQCLHERDHTLSDFAQLFAMRLQQHVVQSIQNGLEAVQLLKYFTNQDGSNSLPTECEARLYRYAHEAAKFHGIEEV